MEPYRQIWRFRLRIGERESLASETEWRCGRRDPDLQVPLGSDRFSPKTADLRKIAQSTEDLGWPLNGLQIITKCDVRTFLRVVGAMRSSAASSLIVASDGAYQ